MGWACAAVGVLANCGAAFDWEWFMNSQKARIFVHLFGRGGARIFYGVLGAALIGAGVFQG